MATPQWARFSSIPSSPGQVLAVDLQRIMRDYGMALWVVNELGVREETSEIGDIDAPFVECASVDEALRLSSNWAGVAMTFRLPDIGESLAINIWRQDSETVVCLYFSSGLMWYREDGHEEGEWLLKFLIRFTADIKASCSGYGRDDEYHFKYRPLDPEAVVGRVLDGSLLHIPNPVIHCISESLLTLEALESAIRIHGTWPRLAYRHSTTGYHVIYNF
jgi:hypothetical protein